MIRLLSLLTVLFTARIYAAYGVLYDYTGSIEFGQSVAKIESSLPIYFYKDKPTSLYVHSNGFIVFNEQQVWSPSDFRSNRIVAPCMVEIQDYNNLGNIRILKTTNSTKLAKATADVVSHFAYQSDFIANQLIIITWEGLLSKETTMQTIFIIGSSKTFALFLYHSPGDSLASLTNLDAQAGFSNGDRVRFTELLDFRAGRNFTFLFENSNTMTTGKWIFELGTSSDTSFQIKMPDTYMFFDKQLGTLVRKDIDECSMRIAACHRFALCTNTDPGYSCTCMKDYFGNGRVCMRKADRVKLIGKVKGIINNIEVKDADFDAFINNNKGELYVSIGPVGPRAGYSLQMIPPITGLLGWLFGAGVSAKTGFDVVGNRFTSTSIIIFQTGEALHVTQQMKGFDSFNFLVFDTVIKGEMPLPLVQASSTHRFSPYSENYVVVKDGRVYSDGSITYILDGRSINYTVNRLINYETRNEKQKYQATVKVSNSIGSYYERSSLLRFIQKYSIGSLKEDSKSDLKSTNKPETKSPKTVEEITRQSPKKTEVMTKKESDPVTDSKQRITTIKPTTTTKKATKEIKTTPLQTTTQPIKVTQGTRSKQTTSKPTCNGYICSDDAVCRLVNEIEQCVCKPGFIGNGYFCQVDKRITCGSATCSENGECITQQSQSFCQCKKGFVGDGIVCKVDVPCDCHMDAECYSNGQGSKYCLCKLGFKGNGKNCRDIDECTETKISCQSHSKCVNSIGSYQCVCDEGFRKNGSKCLDIPECTEQQDACGDRAVCTEIPGSYKCNCPKGYHFGYGRRDCFADCPRCLNGGTCFGKFGCKCPPGYSGNICQWVGDEFLLYSQGGNIKRFSYPYGPLSYGYIFREPRHLMVGVDYDCKDKMVYWTDITSKTIQRSAYNGSNMEIIIRGLHDPQGLTIDWLGRNIYWTDTGSKQIQVASLDGKYKKLLFSKNLRNPRAIVCNPYSGQLFWTDWDRRRPRIEVSSMDGTGRKLLVSRDIGLPNGLTIDYKSRDICWTDAAFQSLSCVGMDGRNQRVLAKKIGYPFGLTVQGNNIFWTNWKSDNIGKFNLESNNAEPEVKSGFGQDGRILDIKSVSACPARKNICSKSNGGCSHFCLMRNDAERTCACPDNNENAELGCFETTRLN